MVESERVVGRRTWPKGRQVGVEVELDDDSWAKVIKGLGAKHLQGRGP